MTMIMLSPLGLHDQVVEALRSAGVDPDQALRVDFVLALLRINTPEALSCAQELAGRPIQVCPSGMPPWPPKPTANPQGPAPKGRSVRKVGQNPCRPGTKAHDRFRSVRVGLTRQEILARGVDKRDLRNWIKDGHVEFTQ